MKSVTFLLKGFLPLFLSLFAVSALAQNPLPICSGSGAGMLHFTSLNASGALEIYKMNPSTPGTTVSTGITLPTGSVALAVSSNRNLGTPDPTYYTTFQIGLIKYLHWWNGFTWVNTTHIMNVDNITGAGPYIYGLDSQNHYVYSYTGAANASFIVDPGPVGSGDIAGDCAGNFYVINQVATVPYIKKFSPTGALLATYTLTGNFGTPGNGFAVNGNNVMYDGADGKLYTGVISGTTVFMSASAITPFVTQPTTDFGSCGYAGFGNSRYATDTVKFCAGASNVILTATGPGPYNWTVLSGPAVITGSGSTVLSSTVGSEAWNSRDLKSRPH